MSLDLDAILAEIERGEYDEDMLYRAVEALVGRIQELEAAHARAVRSIASLDGEAEARARKAEAELERAEEQRGEAEARATRLLAAWGKAEAERDTLRGKIEMALAQHGMGRHAYVGQTLREALTQGGGERMTMPTPEQRLEAICGLACELLGALQPWGFYSPEVRSAATKLTVAIAAVPVPESAQGAGDEQPHPDWRNGAGIVDDT